MFGSSFGAVSIIFIFLIIGFLMTHFRWITKENKQLLSRIVLYLAVPCTIFTNMRSAVTLETFGEMWGMVAAPFCTVILIYAAASLLGKFLLKVAPNRQGTFAVMCSCANTVFVGLPVITSLYGEPGSPYVMYYLVAQTSLFWSLGAMGIQKDGMGVGYAPSMGEIIKKIFNLNTVVILIALATVVLRMAIPSIVLDVGNKLGAMATPLSLIFCGNSMYEVYTAQGTKGIFSLSRDTYLVFLFRFCICPLFTFAFCTLLEIQGLVREVFVIVSALPTQANTVVLTGRYGADDAFASLTFFWTTLLSLGVIPLLLFLLREVA